MRSLASGRRLRGAHLRLALLPLACVLDLPDACANDLDDPDVEFDAGMLRLRGIDPKLAGYFREAPRFIAGHHVVSLRVNGRSMGSASVRISQHGRLCVDRTFLDTAEITLPRDIGADVAQDTTASCLALAGLLPSATVELDPAKSEVSLVVPADVLRAKQRDMSGYARGGTAALLNYEVTALNSRWDARSSRYISANTELGFNAGDWVVRSRQVSTSSDGRHDTEVLDTYAQRTFAEHRSVLQFGQLNVMNPVLPGAQVTGVQIMSEQALATQAGGATVEGVAQGQASVEVRQEGVLVYSTIVPAGPFVLKDIPRINRHADLDVTVSGAGADVQRFAVPAAMAGTIAPPTGYSLAIGKTRNMGVINAPWLMSGGWSGSLGRRLNVSGGATMATKYGAIGGGLGTVTGSGSQWQFDLAGSRTSREGQIGAQATLALSQRFGQAWSFALSHTRRSVGYRDLLDTTWVGENVRVARYRDQTSASLAWSTSGLGNLSAGLSRSSLFDGRSTKRALASWSSRVGRASVSLSAEWNLSQGRRSGNNSLYLSVSVPLGENRRMINTVRRYAGETRYGASFSEQVNEFASYRAGFEYRSGDHRRSSSFATSLLPRYVQMDAGYAYDTRSRNSSLGLRGGLVWHEHGVTASPYAIRDTFGVLSVGDAAGIRISTPGGPVWTDARGYAVLSQLNPYGKSNIEVATDSLPKDTDIRNGGAVVSAGRGAVATLAFGVNRTRRVLLRARTAMGTSIPFGAAVTDDQGEIVGVVQRDGEIFVPNALATPRLWVSGPDTPACQIDIEPSAHASDGAYYESASAVCLPTESSSR